MVTRLVLGLLLLSAQTLCRAEVLFDIHPLDTLGDIRSKFPNATITTVKAAWVREGQGFYSLTGNGQPGKLMLAFDDERPGIREMHNERVQSALETPPTDEEMKFLDFLAKKGNADENAAMVIQWVRWIPPSPIPLERYNIKHGQPTKCDFTDDDMEPYCIWRHKALTVKLTDDRKQVISVETDFTPQEQASAWLQRYKYVPKHLREALAPPAKPNKKAPAKPSGRPTT